MILYLTIKQGVNVDTLPTGKELLHMLTNQVFIKYEPIRSKNDVLNNLKNGSIYHSNYVDVISDIVE